MSFHTFSSLSWHISVEVHLSKQVAKTSGDKYWKIVLLYSNG